MRGMVVSLSGELLHTRRRRSAGRIALVIQMLSYAFGGPDIYYDESDREATVVLDTDEVDLDVLIRLKTTGLAAKFEVLAGNADLNIKFIVSPELDHLAG